LEITMSKRLYGALITTLGLGLAALPTSLAAAQPAEPSSARTITTFGGDSVPASTKEKTVRPGAEHKAGEASMWVTTEGADHEFALHTVCDLKADRKGVIAFAIWHDLDRPGDEGEIVGLARDPSSSGGCGAWGPFHWVGIGSWSLKACTYRGSEQMGCHEKDF
jgi:hypothetical protein